MIVARILIFIFMVSTLLITLSLIPDYYNILVSHCLLEGCGYASPAPPTTEELLHAAGLTTSGYAFLFVLIDATFIILFAISTFIIFFKSRREPMALLASVMLISFGTTFPQLVHTATADSTMWTYWFSIVSAIGWISLFLFFSLFPNGSMTPRWTAVPIILFAIIKLSSVLFTDTILDHNQWPAYLNLLLFGVPIAMLIYIQLQRFRNCSIHEVRQQTKWVIYGFSFGFLSFISISLLFYPGLFESPIAYVYLNGLLHLFLFIFPITLTLAILRQRLWMVDPIMNRTLVYLALTASIAVVYTLSILYLGSILHAGSSIVPSLLSTAIVAIIFAPLRDRLQRYVDRFMKGRHDDPYGLLLELRSLLVQSLPPEEMLETIVRFIRLSLRIPYAAIAIEVNGVRRIASSDSDGTTASGHTFPIIHLGKEVGTLIAAHRPGEPFTSLDHKLLNVLLSHAGPIVDNYMMTRGMKLLADDLQHSREKLILAREEERRRIRRNLHDELAPRLAALGLNATAAEMYVKRDPETATELLSELRQVIRSTVEDIRTLVHDMRPASLDEWGLEGAIQERIRELNKPLQAVGQLDDGINDYTTGLHFEFHLPSRLPVLPAAVEVAAYWIATEAIGNVVRHSQATSCSVTLDAQSAGLLTLEIVDNGIGIDECWLSAMASSIGINSMQERAAELGGSCTVGLHPRGGTIVSARLPIVSTAMIS